MAISKQQANNYLNKYLGTDFDSVITCAENITSINEVAANLTPIAAAVQAAIDAEASAVAAAASASTGLLTVVAGTNVTVDNTDPRNPIISSSGGVGGGQVDSVVGGTNITVDVSDPANPIANLDALAKGDVGLANVDNTSDATKQAATLAAATASDVGLSNVANTTDANKPVSTATQTALDGKVDDAQVLTNVPSGALFTDTNTTYSIGDGGLTEINFTSAKDTKLNDIAVNANNYVHPTSDGSLHVPANGVSNTGKVLTASATAGVYTWEVSTSGFTSPLSTKGDILVYDTDNARLPLGTQGQILSADIAEATGLKWVDAGAAVDPLTTKGDILVYTTASDRLSAGTQGQVLTVDVSTAAGVKWATPTESSSDYGSIADAVTITLDDGDIL